MNITASGNTRPRATSRILVIAAALAACAALGAGCPGAPAVTPPQQPATGPGGADYTSATVNVQRLGEGADEYWLFTPADPVPASAPLVVFLHGWAGMNPRCYSAWIEHLVRKGNIVVYPRYQLDLLTNPAEMTGHAANAVNSAWQTLLAADAPKPDMRGIVYAGHSLGGLIAMNAPDRLAALGLPPASVLYVVQSGGERYIKPRAPAALAEGAVALIVVGADDVLVRDRAGRQALADLAAVMPANNLEFVTVRSERRSTPALIANHFAPLAVDGTFPAEDLVTGVDSGFGPCAANPGGIGTGASEQDANQAAEAPDALDYFGYWKLLDGLIDTAFRNGANRSYALGDTAQQQYMGRLSDGSTVASLVVENP